MATKKVNVPQGAQILNSIRASIVNQGDMKLDYENRIPEATKDNLKEVGKALLEYKPAMNEFLNELVNKIGMTYVRRKMYRNKLAFLKRGMLEYGDTIEEIFVDIAKAKHYTPVPADDNLCDVWEVNKPKIVSAFHKVNREDMYTVTINEAMLKRAFSGYANFDSFIAGIFDSIYKADEYDEYVLFKHLIGETVKNSYLVNVTLPVDRATSEEFSVKMRANGLALEYLSRDYNQLGVATNTPLSEQILILKSSVVPVIDVLQLANNFNLNLGQPISGRIIVIDDFGINNDDIIGCIIDKDFSMIWDTVYRTESIYNPRHMYWNYFLHHHQLIASSPFANCIGFTTGSVVGEVTGVKILPETQIIPKGYSNSIQTIVDTNGGQVDTSVSYEIATPTSENTKVENGVVYVGSDETVSELTITATTTSGSKTATAKIIVPQEN